MSTPEHPRRICFSEGDCVEFEYRKTGVKGTILRANPARAVVATDQGEFRVPYECLTGDPAATEERRQKIDSIHRQAHELLKQHELPDWKFCMDHSTRRAGACNYRDKTISISHHLALNGSANDILDTLLHEIAHALVGRKHNHDAVWKAKAREIGCSGDRTHRMELAPPRWRVRCENNCWSHTAQRRNPRLICRTCGGRLVYSAFR
ncbi:MAG: SprT-like domain-containing protein [Pontiellaceae bacterium]|nr:SprT-like domain-containing protein [Pontiellaceae bacterium]MBN2784784.1 SprT-like domain-containing protein [Pontiellaceae bacterium]